MKWNHPMSRRTFCQKISTSAVGFAVIPHIIPASALGREGTVPPSERITLGIIGTGDHGVNRNIKRFLPEPDAQILAVCDVDRDRRIGAKRLIEERYADMFEKGTYKGCDDYNDFREIIARDDIDAIMNATPVTVKVKKA